MYRVTEIKCTCDACPTQFEGRFEDGDELYIRYRWGELTVSKAAPGRMFTADEIVLVETDGGAEFDGVLEDAELIAMCKDVIEFPADFVEQAQANPDERGDSLARGFERFIANSKEHEESGSDQNFFTWRRLKYASDDAPMSNGTLDLD